MPARPVAAYLDVAVADEAVLRKVRADGDGCRVSPANTEIDVRQCAVEGTRVGIRRLTSLGGNTTGEPHHVLLPFLVARRIGCQIDDGTPLSIPNQPHGRRNLDGTADAVLAFGQEEDTEVFLLLHLENGTLQGVGHILPPIGLKSIVLRGEVIGLGVIRPLGVDRLQLHRVQPAAYCA